MIASNRCPCLRTEGRPTRPGERQDEGYALIAVLVAVFLVLLALSVAAPAVARALRRDRELEAVHRADQYVRAIQLYYRKFGHYPGSLDQLEKSNNIRFLRQRYADPMTGKPDWRLIKVGTNKTTVKGFFGQPLAGIASTGLGSATGLSSGIGTGPSSAGSPTTASSPMTAATGSSPFATGSGAAAGSATAAGAGTADTSSSTPTFGGGPTSTPGAASPMGTSGGIAGQSATSFTGGGAPFLGVGLPTSGIAILTVNEKTTYPDWEFIYDPRIEQLRGKVNLLGGGVGGTGSSTLGSASTLGSTGTPGTFGGPSAPPPTGSSPSTPTGTSPSPQ